MNRFKTVVIITLLVVMFTGMSVMAEDNLKTFISGMENYYQGNYEQAFNILNTDLENKNIKKEIKVNILYYRTLSQIELYKIVEAKKTIKKLKDIGYEFAYLYRKLGEVYLNKKGQFDYPFYNEARKNLIKANNLGINSIGLHTDLAVSYEGLNELEKALNEYEIILKKDESKIDYNNLASLYKEKGNNEKAILYYNKALNKDGKNISIYLNLGDLYLKSEEYKKAVDILKKGKNIDSKFVALHFKLARAYYYNEDYEKAKNEFNHVITINKNYYQAYYYLGEINKLHENWQNSIYNYELATKYNPDFADAYIAMGNIYLKQENYYKAISCFSSAIEKNDTYPEGHYRLAITYYKLNMKDAAIKELRTTLHLNNDYKQAKELLNKLQEE